MVERQDPDNFTRFQTRERCALEIAVYVLKKKLPEVPEYSKMQFYMMTLLDVLGKIAWVRSDFLSQGKISDILIRCARNTCIRPPDM